VSSPSQRGNAQPITNPLSFSVVIPTHKGRASIQTAVKSILEQSWPHFELAVVADGDSEATRTHLSGISDRRLLIFDQAPQGVGPARNRGIAETASPWLTFLDDDDVARPEFLETWVSMISVDTVALTAAISQGSPETGATIRQCHLLPADPTLGASRILAGGFAVRRDVIQAIGGYDPNLTFAENQDLGLRLCEYICASSAGKVIHTDEVLTDIRVEHSTTRIARYGGSRGDAVTILMRRYPERLARDPKGAAALYRILSWSERSNMNYRAARIASIRACRLAPGTRENWRSLVLALFPWLAEGRTTRHREAVL